MIVLVNLVRYAGDITARRSIKVVRRADSRIKFEIIRREARTRTRAVSTVRVMYAGESSRLHVVGCGRMHLVVGERTHIMRGWGKRADGVDKR